MTTDYTSEINRLVVLFAGKIYKLASAKDSDFSKPAKEFEQALSALLLRVALETRIELIAQLKKYATATDGNVYFIKINKRQLDTSARLTAMGKGKK